VSERELYLSYGLQAVDAKGRVAVPAKLRSVLEKNADSRELLLKRHAKHVCLSAFDAAWPKLLYSRRPQGSDEDADTDYNVAGKAFGNLETAPFDSAGRFVLPTFYRRRAKIDKWAFFHGRGDTFNIWDPFTLIADIEIDADTRELCEFLMEEKGLQ